MQLFIPWSSSVSVFVIQRTAIIHSLKCTVPFSLVLPLLSIAVTAIFYHSLSLVVLLAVTLCHLLHQKLSFVVTRCHSLYYLLSIVVTRCHSLSIVVPLVFIRCHSLSFVLTRCVTRCHSLSFVVTRCTTRLSFYKQSISSIVCQSLHI